MGDEELSTTVVNDLIAICRKPRRLVVLIVYGDRSLLDATQARIQGTMMSIKPTNLNEPVDIVTNTSLKRRPSMIGNLPEVPIRPHSRKEQQSNATTSLLPRIMRLGVLILLPQASSLVKHAEQKTPAIS